MLSYDELAEPAILCVAPARKRFGYAGSTRARALRQRPGAGLLADADSPGLTRSDNHC
jgi:hypothetical protein